MKRYAALFLLLLLLVSITVCGGQQLARWRGIDARPHTGPPDPGKGRRKAGEHEQGLCHCLENCLRKESAPSAAEPDAIQKSKPCKPDLGGPFRGAAQVCKEPAGSSGEPERPPRRHRKGRTNMKNLKKLTILHSNDMHGDFIEHGAGRQTGGGRPAHQPGDSELPFCQYGGVYERIQRRGGGERTDQGGHH